MKATIIWNKFKKKNSFLQDYIISLVKGAEIPQPNTANANISKLLINHENKQRQLREEIKVCGTCIIFNKKIIQLTNIFFFICSTGTS